MNQTKIITAKTGQKHVFGENLVSGPEIVEFEEKHCIGYTISTSVIGGQMKEDIPPFFHDIYDNQKLKCLWSPHQRDMYCIFDRQQNGLDFNYYITTENFSSLHQTGYAEIAIPEGNYVKATLLKRNQAAVLKIMMYLQNIWIKENGYSAGNGPAFVVYDERFHVNYEKHGCEGGNYLGHPEASLYIPIDK